MGHLSDVFAATIGRVDVDLGFGRQGKVLTGSDWCVLRLCSNHEALTGFLLLNSRRTKDVYLNCGWVM